MATAGPIVPRTMVRYERRTTRPTFGGPLVRVVWGVLGFAATGCTAKLEGTATVDAESGAEVRVEAKTDSGGEVKFRLEDDQLRYEGPGEVHFATNSAQLVGDDTFAILDELAAFLLEYPEVEIRIEGHTDSRGSEAYNRDLSLQRAAAVADYLAQKGVDRKRLVFEGHGESRPKVPEPEACRDRSESTAPAWCETDVWSKNRRTEFHVTAGRETLELKLQASTDTPDGGPEEGWNPGAYVYAAPIFFTVPVADPSASRYRLLSYQWGLGAGYLFAPAGAFRLGLGVGLEHAPMRVRTEGRCRDPLTGGLSPRCEGMHEVRAGLELRLGGAGKRAFGYGLLGPALAVGRTDTGTWYGFSWTIGAGIWGRVWRGLFLGAEAGFDLMTFGDMNDGIYDGFMANFDLKGVVGWHFGWKSRSR
ncbi:MAG: OmpA family protein [Deltaproteobacteria bacterium]|nr:MAG: OmpA family protein [Deltaproteobacteria bacterium]